MSRLGDTESNVDWGKYPYNLSSHIGEDNEGYISRFSAHVSRLFMRQGDQVRIYVIKSTRDFGDCRYSFWGL
jgi:hypothetical protein